MNGDKDKPQGGFSRWVEATNDGLLGVIRKIPNKVWNKRRARRWRRHRDKRVGSDDQAVTLMSLNKSVERRRIGSNP